MTYFCVVWTRRLAVTNGFCDSVEEIMCDDRRKVPIARTNLHYAPVSPPATLQFFSNRLLSVPVSIYKIFSRT